MKGEHPAPGPAVVGEGSVLEATDDRTSEKENQEIFQFAGQEQNGRIGSGKEVSEEEVGRKGHGDDAGKEE